MNVWVMCVYRIHMYDCLPIYIGFLALIVSKMPQHGASSGTSRKGRASVYLVLFKGKQKEHHHFKGCPNKNTFNLL